MLLPIRLAYNSWRVSRSSRWPMTSLLKLRPSCKMPRTICDTMMLIVPPGRSGCIGWAAPSPR